MNRGKIVIITGANSGIGKAAAIRFAGAGYHVVMACRNLEKSETAQQDIIRKSGSDYVDLIQLDVSSFASIAEFAMNFKARYGKLDILINNAGYFKHDEKSYSLSVDGIEQTFATNTFGPFLLTLLLKDSLSASDDPRVLNASTTNIKYFFDPKREIDWDNLRGEFKENRPYNPYKFYGDSKIAFLMLSMKLAEEFANDRIKVNSVMIPAIKIGKDTINNFRTLYWKTMARLMNLIARPPEAMAETYFNICTSPHFQAITGKLLNIHSEIMNLPSYTGKPGFRIMSRELRRMTQIPAFATNRKNTDRIWELAMKLTKDQRKMI